MDEPTKRCPKCGIERPLAQWGKNRANRDGLQGNCNPCRAEWRRQNREEIRAKDRVYTARNRETARQRAREWRAANSERARENNRAYYLANKHRWPKRTAEQRRETDRAYRSRRREQMKLYMADYYLANPTKFIEYSNRRRARKRAAAGTASAVSVQARIDYYGGKCWVCSAPWEQVDHVKPLAGGGSNWPANLRPICRACNARKKARWYGTDRLHELVA